MKDSICKNCGAWKGLHHFETLQCPRNGVEANIGQSQLWEQTTYRSELTNTEAELLEALKNLYSTSKEVKIKHFVPLGQLSNEFEEAIYIASKILR